MLMGTRKLLKTTYSKSLKQKTRNKYITPRILTILWYNLWNIMKEPFWCVHVRNFESPEVIQGFQFSTQVYIKLCNILYMLMEQPCNLTKSIFNALKLMGWGSQSEHACVVSQLINKAKYIHFIGCHFWFEILFQVAATTHGKRKQGKEITERNLDSWAGCRQTDVCAQSSSRAADRSFWLHWCSLGRK